MTERIRLWSTWIYIKSLSLLWNLTARGVDNSVPPGSPTPGTGPLPTMLALDNQSVITKVPVNPCFVTIVSMEIWSRSIGRIRRGRKRGRKIFLIVLCSILNLGNQRKLSKSSKERWMSTTWKKSLRTKWKSKMPRRSKTMKATNYKNLMNKISWEIVWKMNKKD